MATWLQSSLEKFEGFVESVETRVSSAVASSAPGRATPPPEVEGTGDFQGFESEGSQDSDTRAESPSFGASSPSWRSGKASKTSRGHSSAAPKATPPASPKRPAQQPTRSTTDSVPRPPASQHPTATQPNSNDFLGVMGVGAAAGASVSAWDAPLPAGAATNGQPTPLPATQPTPLQPDPSAQGTAGDVSPPHLGTQATRQERAAPRRQLAAAATDATPTPPVAMLETPQTPPSLPSQSTPDPTGTGHTASPDQMHSGSRHATAPAQPRQPPGQSSAARVPNAAPSADSNPARSTHSTSTQPAQAGAGQLSPSPGPVPAATNAAPAAAACAQSARHTAADSADASAAESADAPANGPVLTARPGGSVRPKRSAPVGVASISGSGVSEAPAGSDAAAEGSTGHSLRVPATEDAGRARPPVARPHAASADLREQAEELQAQRDTLITQKAALIGRLDDAMGELEALRAEAASARDAAQAAEGRAGKAASAAAMKAATEHATEVAGLRAQLREDRERAKLKADQLVSCEARLGQVESELEAAQRDARGLRAQLNDVQSAHQDEQSAAAQETHMLVQQLQQELSGSQETERKLRGQLEEARNEVGLSVFKSAERIEQLEAALAVAQQRASTSSRAVEEAVEAAEEAQAAASVLREELAQVRSAEASPAGHSAAEVQALQVAVEREHARAETARAAAEAARGQIDDLERQLVTQQSAIARAATADLQQQLTQAQQLLLERQAQWERLGAEKAAQLMTLERQLADMSQQLSSSHRSDHRGHGGVAHALSADVVPMEALGTYYHRIASNRRFGGAVRAFGGTLDSWTAHVLVMLRSQPLARLVLFVYLIGIHLFVYLLLAHMQHLSFLREHAATIAGRREP